MAQTPHNPASRSLTFIRLIIGALLLVALVTIVVLVSGRRLVPQDGRSAHLSSRLHGFTFFDYRVSTEPGRIRIDGTANLPNGVILVGTLDKMGMGPLEVKEAMVMNRIFSMEFGPDLQVQYYLLGPAEAITPGVYRIAIEFDPAQQSPFAREALFRALQTEALTEKIKGGKQIDPAVIRVVKSLAVGTPQEQDLAKEHDQEYRQQVRLHLIDAMHGLAGLWQRLYHQYHQERLQGVFSRTDGRAHAWQQWLDQWLSDLAAQAEESHLHAVFSPASPYHAVRHLLATAHRQLPTIPALLFEVLLGERSPVDPDLQRAEQQIRYALADAQAQLGLSEMASSPTPDVGSRATVIVTSPQVNIRHGPSMSHESFSWARKDAVLPVLSEDGEWLQIQLADGRRGWVHRTVVSKQSSANGTTGAIQASVSAPLSTAQQRNLQLDPVALASTVIDYLPRPTVDEFKIYGELEQQLRDIETLHPEQRRIMEQQILQHAGEKYPISPSQIWNAYLKVQGWELRE